MEGGKKPKEFIFWNLWMIEEERKGGGRDIGFPFLSFPWSSSSFPAPLPKTNNPNPRNSEVHGGGYGKR